MTTKTISGVYCIENTVSNKKYIGSSKDIGGRIKRHFRYLKCNYHPNKHLQASYHKYDITAFKFSVLEECDESMLFEREQYYINSYDWEFLYNTTKIAGKGGSDTQKMPMYLIDLTGNIIKEFESGIDIDRYLSLYTAYSWRKNTSSIIQKKYRIVTPDFYENNKETILSWKSYSNEAVHKSMLAQQKRK